MSISICIGITRKKIHVAHFSDRNILTFKSPDGKKKKTVILCDIISFTLRSNAFVVVYIFILVKSFTLLPPPSLGAVWSFGAYCVYIFCPLILLYIFGLFLSFCLIWRSGARNFWRPMVSATSVVLWSVKRYLHKVIWLFFVSKLH